jgi:hypothetical protein
VEGIIDKDDLNGSGPGYIFTQTNATPLRYLINFTTLQAPVVVSTLQNGGSGLSEPFISGRGAGSVTIEADAGTNFIHFQAVEFD